MKQPLCDQFFASSRLAGDQHTRIRRGQTLESFDHRLHLVAGIDDAFKTKTLVQSLLQINIGLLQANGVSRLGRHGSQPVRCERLFHKVKSPLLHCFDRFRNRRMSGHHDHFAVRQRLLSSSQNLLAVDFVHHQIGDHDIKSILVNPTSTLGSGSCDRTVITHAQQRLSHSLPHGYYRYPQQGHVSLGRY